MLTLFIADDETTVREGLKKILNWTELGFEICGEGTNGLNTLEGILMKNPDLVLLDIRMPKMHGTELAKQARSQGFKGRIIILSGYSDFKYAQDAIRWSVSHESTMAYSTLLKFSMSILNSLNSKPSPVNLAPLIISFFNTTLSPTLNLPISLSPLIISTLS